MNNKDNNSKGIVALTLVLFACILFSLITVMILAVVTSETRQATLADFSNTAFYSAQSGLDYGLKLIKDSVTNGVALPNDSVCERGLPSGLSNVCLIMKYKKNELTHSIAADQAPYQVDLTGTALEPDNTPGTISTIVISWHDENKNADGTLYTLNPPGSSFCRYANPSCVGSPYAPPATLELQQILVNQAKANINSFSSNPANFNVNSSDLKIIKDILVPSSGYGFSNSGTNCIDDYGNDCLNENDETGKTTDSRFIGGIAAYTNNNSDNTPPYYAKCNNPNIANSPNLTYNGSYACSVQININSAGQQYLRILRIRARYRGTTFSIRVFDSSGNQLTVPDSYESIDVTATAGSAGGINASRRVLGQVKIQNSFADVDYALFSDTSICHDFRLRDSRTGSSTGVGGVDAANYGSCPF